MMVVYKGARRIVGWSTWSPYEAGEVPSIAPIATAFDNMSTNQNLMFSAVTNMDFCA